MPRDFFKTLTPARQIASLLGKFVWAVPSVPFAQAHYRCLQRRVLDTLRTHQGDYEGNVKLDDVSRTELRWWAETIDFSHGKRIEV